MHRRDDATNLPAAAPRRAGSNLPRRFFALAQVSQQVKGYAVLLDGKLARTPGRKDLAVPFRAAAEALAAEWNAQGEYLDPKTMALTRLVNAAIDGIVGNEATVAADAAKYAGSDLICYRADFPEELVALQRRHWDPVLAWVEREFDCQFARSTGVVHVQQTPLSLAAIHAVVANRDAFALAGLHSMSALLGSVLLALGVTRGELTAEAAWTAAHVDEDWQARKWGVDAEAAERRKHRWSEMNAAVLLARCGVQDSDAGHMRP